MEFREKLQMLRKKQGLTQEELAQLLYVSRTAVSKWESGRGFPNMDSLRRLACVFSVTVDELLSGEQLLCLAEEDGRRKAEQTRHLVFGLLDIATSLLLFLPFFAQRGEPIIRGVSLLALTGVSSYIKMIYAVLVAVIVVWGVLVLAMQNCRRRFLALLSMGLTAMGVLIFTLSLQPYAAGYLFIFLLIKVFLLVTRRVSVM